MKNQIPSEMKKVSIQIVGGISGYQSPSWMTLYRRTAWLRRSEPGMLESQQWKIGHIQGNYTNT
jgi:hypothetical protein